MTLTLTVDLPDNIVHRLSSLGPAERSAITSLALSDMFASVEGLEELGENSAFLTPADLESLQRGLQDADAARTVEGKAFFENLARHLTNAGRPEA